MTQEQWEQLLALVAGETIDPLPVGFIIDSPWLPGWSGISTMDYFADDQAWFVANLKAVQAFPQVLFLPGFWPEFGMCTEPSAFGSKCVWHSHELPFAQPILKQAQEIDNLSLPNPQTDGLCPFVLHRLAGQRSRIEAAGHQIRFAVARGPLNIASFLMGATEFLMGLRDEPRRMHQLLNLITDFLVAWLELQRKTVDTVDGVLILDDIVGFCGEPDYLEFAEPYLKTLFTSLDVSIRAFHNDADGRACAPHLAKLGVNLFNFSFLHSLAEMRAWTGPEVTLFGNIPPRDVLALGSTEQVKAATQKMLQDAGDKHRILFSGGGGMTDGVSTENLQAFIRTVQG